MESAQITIYSLCSLMIALMTGLSVMNRRSAVSIRGKYSKKPYIFGLIILPTIFYGVLQIVINPGIPFVYVGVMLSFYVVFVIKNPQTIAITGEDTEPILKRNEYNANCQIEYIVMVAFSSLVPYFFLYKPPDALSIREYYIFIPGLFLGISIILSRVKTGRYFHHIKYLLIFVIILIFGGFSLGYGAANMIALPIVLGISSRYYNRWFMNACAVITSLVMIFFLVISYRYLGVVDLSILKLPPGTVLTIPESMWIEDALSGIDLIAPEVFNSYLANLLVGYLGIFVMQYLLFLGINKSLSKTLSLSVNAAREKAMLEADLEVASKIQNSMLPTDFDKFDGSCKVDIKATLFTAKEVGGDFYNFFSMDRDHVCVIVGDVSGKGIPASLFMSKAQTSLKTIALLETAPSLIMRRVNNIMKEGNDENFFATVWLGVITLSTGDLEFVSAGHNAPLFARSSGKYEYMTEETDFVIGLMEDMEYVSYHRRLQPGDSILIYTDGVVDATNTRNEKYGEDRLLDFMNSISKVTNLEKIDKLKQEVFDYTGEATQFDDVTIMSIKYLEGAVNLL